MANFLPNILVFENQAESLLFLLAKIWSNFSYILTYIIFFCLGNLIFIFAFGADLEKLSELSFSIIWVIIIFSIILGSENFVKNDFNDGSLKEMQFLGYREELIIFSKAFVMWMILIIPIILFLPIFSLFFSINLEGLISLAISIILASPSLILISLISALLSLQIKENRLLQFVIIIPFYIPILIFSVINKQSFLINQVGNDRFSILIAIFFITLPLMLVSGKLILKEINN